VLGWVGKHDIASSKVVDAILLERCHESLRAYWITERGLVAPDVSQHIMKGLMRGLAHMHSLSIVHLDLTPNSIILVWGLQKKRGLTPNKSDFGSAMLLCSSDALPVARTRSDLRCTWTYRAPEISLGLPFRISSRRMERRGDRTRVVHRAKTYSN
jgi:serine/threonine protein kinase